VALGATLCGHWSRRWPREHILLARIILYALVFIVRVIVRATSVACDPTSRKRLASVNIGAAFTNDVNRTETRGTRASCFVFECQDVEHPELVRGGRSDAIHVGIGISVCVRIHIHIRIRIHVRVSVNVNVGINTNINTNASHSVNNRICNGVDNRINNSVNSSISNGTNYGVNIKNNVII
jgi:hypothetical protein